MVPQVILQLAITSAKAAPYSIVAWAALLLQAAAPLDC